MDSESRASQVGFSPENPKSSSSKTEDFPIVGIGASAGGLKAFEAFFDALPHSNGIAFILVQHLDPHHESELAELLQSHTHLNVSQVEDQVAVSPNHVYVIPPGKSLTIQDRLLHLEEPHQPRGHRTPIDDFFRSLAVDRTEHAACIILSGTGSDGTLGLKSIKEKGGVVMVQDPAEAEYDGMPRSAIASGLVDIIAPAAQLARKLLEYTHHANRIQLPLHEQEIPEDHVDLVQKILTQVRTQIGHDFSSYKRATIMRRLQRRMQVNGVEEMAAYLDLLRDSREEASALFRDFLISVTNFFRDPDAFAALEREVIPQLFRGKGAGEAVRVWVPGCATGEEAYSIAMLLCEEAEKYLPRPEIQVFASDLNDEALAFARAGCYPDTVGADMLPSRLARYFVHEEQGYRIKRSLQDIVLFAQHNLLEDPPFSRLDLISCRNLMIYLDREVQRQIFTLFHHVLRPDGYLFLGGSETPDGVNPLFKAVHKSHRIYQRQPGSSKLLHPPFLSLNTSETAPAATVQKGEDLPHLGDIHRELMLQRYAPPSLIVDDNFEIRYIFGNAGRYLHRTEGKPTHNLLDNVSKELRIELRTALFQCFNHGKSSEPRRVLLQPEDERQAITLQVEPIRRDDLQAEMALIILEPLSLEEDDTDAELQNERTYDDRVVEQLEDELQRTQHSLQTLVEEYETSNEELKASNEELQSTNEELRSTTEELETSKEELQSTNEELHTVNQELKAKIEELSRANSDLQNLMESTEIATLFLDGELCLQRYTPEATELFHIVPSDLGRPFSHISHKFDYDDLAGMAQRVLRRLEMIEDEVQGKTGRWFVLRMLPYRSVEDRIEGVVATFVDITEQKQYQEQVATRERQQTMVAELGQMALLGRDLQDLMEQAVRQVAETLDVEMCKVLELQPETDDLLLRAGVGWQEGLVGRATVDTGQDSQAGYTLKTSNPVLVEDLSTEKRFSGPPLLTEHGVVSGMSVIIEGPTQPYGILGAHSRHRRIFQTQDAHYLRSVANVLGAAIERQRTEEALRHSEEQALRSLAELQTVYATTPIGLAFVDTELRYVSISGTLARINGLAAEEHLGRPIRHVLPGPLADNVEPYYLRVLNTGEPIEQLEIQGEPGSRPGEVRHYLSSYHPVKDASGALLGIAAVVQDITERKQAEHALHASRQRFQDLVDSLDGIVFEWNPATEQFTYVSARAEEIVGYPVERWLNEDNFWLTQVVRPHDHGEVLEAFEAVRETGCNQTVEYRAQRNNADIIWLRTIMRLVPSEAQASSLIRGIMIDITAQKEAEAQLRVLNETLEQRVNKRTEQIRTLASDLTLAEQRERHRIAHILHDDLQQLLYGADFHLQLLEDTLTDESTAEEAEMLTQLRELLHRSVTITRTLAVDLSPPVLQNEGVVEAIRWFAKQMQNLHNLSVEVTADTPVIIFQEAKRVLLFHTVRELLFNVVKHAGVSHAWVRVHQDEHAVRIEVEDKGRGFDVATVMKPREAPGGLGLYRLQERLELFRGAFDIGSAPGEGTRITLTVPNDAAPGE